MTFYNLKAARALRFLTQKELAEKSGLKYGAAIRKYESGKYSPTFKTLKKIADALDMGIIYDKKYRHMAEYTFFKNDNKLVSEIEKHAKWNINPDGYYPYCSCCKEEPPSGIMTKYCPNCGARMDLEE